MTQLNLITALSSRCFTSSRETMSMGVAVPIASTLRCAISGLAGLCRGASRTCDLWLLPQVEGSFALGPYHRMRSGARFPGGRRALDGEAGVFNPSRKLVHRPAVGGDDLVVEGVQPSPFEEADQQSAARANSFSGWSISSGSVWISEYQARIPPTPPVPQPRSSAAATRNLVRGNLDCAIETNSGTGSRPSISRPCRRR